MKQVEAVAAEDIILRLRNRDELALKQVYRQNYSTLVNMVITNGGSLQEAKDVYQESIIIMYEKLQDENFELTCSLKTFLYSIGRNLWLKVLKEKNRFTDLAGQEEYIELNKSHVFDIEDRYSAMNIALNALGQPCQSILAEYYMNSCSMEEIANRFGYTNADNAKNQKYKCLQRLKKIFFSNYQKEV